MKARAAKPIESRVDSPMHDTRQATGRIDGPEHAFVNEQIPRRMALEQPIKQRPAGKRMFYRNVAEVDNS
jgi:hypothetical protein